MRLHDHGTAAGQGGRVSRRHRKRQRKIAGAEHRDGPQRNLPLPQVGARQGLAIGLRGSTRTSSHSPALTTWANRRNCWQVGLSPWMRARGRPVSVDARSIKASPSASISSAMVSRKRARTSGAVSIAVERRPGQGAGLFDLLARRRRSRARTSSVAGLIAWIASRFPAMVCPPMSMSPVNVMGFPDATDVPMPPAARAGHEGKDQPRRCSADHCAYHWRNSAY